MKRSLLILLTVAAALAAGCATPHRETETSKTLFWYKDRPDGLVAKEEWIDKDKGGALFLFTDPRSQGMTVAHTNQVEIGGSSLMVLSPFEIVVDSNTAAILTAGGNSAGNIIGAAFKAAAPVPKLP